MQAPLELFMAPTEDRLLARCRAGDVDAFGDLYERYERQVYRHAYYLLGSREDAQDVRQETFLKAFRALPSFRGDCPLSAWLLRICTNLCRNQGRSRARRREIRIEEPEVQELPDPRRADTASLETMAVAQALAALPLPAREVLILRELEGLSGEETGTILGCSPATVGMRLWRARRLLKEILKRDFPEEG
jgi:RNA polymerase sigma-70 factor, ECF subfamily